MKIRIISVIKVLHKFFIERALPAIVLPIVIIIMWQIATSYGWWPRTLIASPIEVVRDFGLLISTGELLAHSEVSLIRLLFGFFSGTIIGVFFGSFVGLSKRVERFFAPTIQAFSPIPPTAWIPLIIIFFGIGEVSKVALIAIGAFIIVYVNTFNGFRSTDKGLVEVALIYNKTKKEMIFNVLFPSALPQIITGMRIALGLSWILLIASEMISSKMVSEVTRIQGMGLGWMIFDARRFARPDDMIVGMITIGMLGKITDMILNYFEKKLFKWRQVFSGVV